MKQIGSLHTRLTHVTGSDFVTEVEGVDSEVPEMDALRQMLENDKIDKETFHECQGLVASWYLEVY